MFTSSTLFICIFVRMIFSSMLSRVPFPPATQRHQMAFAMKISYL